MRPESPRARGRVWITTALRAAAATVLALAVAACAPEEERLATHLQRAADYQEAGVPEAAVIELKNALQLDPQNAEVNLRLGELQMEMEAYGEALFYFMEAHRLDTERVDGALKATAILMRADPEEAERILGEALERQPQNVELHVRRSQLAVTQDRWDEAFEAAGVAADLEPQSPDGPLQLGRVRLARIRQDLREQDAEPSVESLGEALEAFDRALELASVPEDVIGARLGRARVLSAWPEREDEARETYAALLEEPDAAARNGSSDDALEMQRTAARAALRFGRRREDPELRRLALQRLIDLRPELVDLWTALAALEESEGGSGEAVLEELLEQQPEDPEAHLAYARFLARRERGEEAITHLERAVANEIDPPRLMTAIAELQYQLDQEGEAAETLEELQEEHPETLQARLTSAQQELRDGNLQEAARALRALTQEEESAEAQRLLAVAELRLGNVTEATRAIERALELAEGFVPGIHRSRVLIQHAAGDWRGALRTLRLLARRGAGWSARERLIRARAFYELGYGEQGRKVVERLLEESEEEGTEPPRGAVLLFASRERDNDPEAVREALQAAAERWPGDAQILGQLAALDRRQGRQEVAFERIHRAIEAAETPDPRLLMLRAAAYQARERYDEAEQDLRRALELAPDSAGALQRLARLYRSQGRLDSAIEALQQAEQSGEIAPQMRVVLARLLLSEGRREEARQTLEAAIVEEDDLPWAKSQLAYVIAKGDGDLDRALDLAQDAQAALGDSPRAAEILGFVYLRKDLPGAARQQFEYAVQLAEERGDSTATQRYHLGLALRALGREEDAIRAFERALADDPEFAEAGRARRQLDAARAALLSSVVSGDTATN